MIYMNIYIPLLFLYHEIKNMKECTKEVPISAYYVNEKSICHKGYLIIQNKSNKLLFCINLFNIGTSNLLDKLNNHFLIEHNNKQYKIYINICNKIILNRIVLSRSKICKIKSTFNDKRFLFRYRSDKKYPDIDLFIKKKENKNYHLQIYNYRLFPIYNNRSILCQKWISSRCKIIDGVPKAYMIDLRGE